MALFMELSAEKRGEETGPHCCQERTTVATSCSAERSNGGPKHCAAAGFVTVICHRNSTFRVLGTTFDDHAVSMARQWSTALIPDAGHGDTVHGKPGRADANYGAAVGAG